MSIWVVIVALVIALLLWGVMCVKIVRLSDHEVAAKGSNQAIRDYTFEKVNGWDLAWISLTLPIPFGIAFAIALCGTLRLAGVL